MLSNTSSLSIHDTSETRFPNLLPGPVVAIAPDSYNISGSQLGFAGATEGRLDPVRDCGYDSCIEPGDVWSSDAESDDRSNTPR